MTSLLLVVTLALAGVLLAGGVGLADPAPVAAGLAAALVLEALARALPYFGSFSVAPAVYLGFGVAMEPSVGALLAAAGNLFRLAQRRPGGPLRRGRDFVAENLPVFAALLVVGSMPLFLLAPFYVLLTFLVPGLLAVELPSQENRRWGELQLRLLLPCAAIGFLGAAGGLMLGDAWLLLPALLALSLYPLPEPTTGEPAGDRYGIERMRLEAHRMREELNTIDTFLYSVAGLTEPGPVLERLVSTVQRLTGAASVAVFLRTEAGLTPAESQTPHRERLKDASLLQLREPAVELAWQRKTAVRVESEPATQRIFEGEALGLAVPVEREGVLYCGGQGEPFPEEAIRFLERLGRLSAGAIQAARVHQALAGARLSLEQSAQWIQLLGALLDSTRAVASTLDPQAVLKRVESNLREAVPHECGWIVDRGGVARSWTEIPEQRLRPDSLQELAAWVAESGRPLLVDDLAGSRIPQPATGQKSLLAVPLLGDREILGALILTSSQPGSFSRQHQHYLEVLGSLSAIFLSNAGLYQELADTHRRLEESQAQLLHANKMAAVGQLAAGVAHEINNPLMAIQVNVEMLQPEDPDDRESLGMISEAVERCRGIVQQLLTFSRKAREQKERLALTELVEQGLRLLPPLENVELELRTEHPAVVEGSREELLQVVTNLIANAREAVQERRRAAGEDYRGRIEVRVDQRDGAASLEVADNGPGVPAELTERIFEPFFTTRDVGQGTGLGLYLAYTVVENHGGTIELVPAAEGACFRVRLPAAS
ncbi:MAG: GAF domain-containing protein [Armatimonadetes bacterium]|nr:GAF domain-containing protein [Armatimonadota bacterium]